jgi:hypothetical protein
MSVSFLMSVIFSLFFSRKQRKSGVSDPFILNLRTKCKRVVNFIPRSLIRKNHCFSMIRKLCGLVSRSSGYDLEQTILLHLPGIETQLLTRPTLSLATVRQLCPGSLTLLCVNNKCFNQNHFNYMHHHHGFFILTLLLRFSLFFYLGLWSLDIFTRQYRTVHVWKVPSNHKLLFLAVFLICQSLFPLYPYRKPTNASKFPLYCDVWSTLLHVSAY